MKTKHFLLSATLSVFFQSNAQVVDLRVHFPKGSAVIEDQSLSELKSWANDHQSECLFTVMLRGHTDSDAGDDYNLKLSGRRNKAVEKVLRKIGFTNIKHTSHGESWPVCESPDDVCMHTNRRVEVVLLNTEEEQYSEKTFEETPQTWFVHDLESHQFNTKNGTVLYLPESPFVGVDGTPVVDYRLEVHEFLTPEACIRHKMFTKSDDKLLQTGGMLYIMAYSGREVLQLGEDKTFDILFPSQSQNPDSEMQSFTGTIENGTINWKPSAFSSLAVNKKTEEYRFSRKFLQKDGSYLQSFFLNNTLVDVTYTKTDPPVAKYECPNGADCQLSSEQRSKLLTAIDGNRPAPGALTFSSLGWANCEKFYRMNDFANVAVECRVNGEIETLQYNNLMIAFPNLGVLVSSSIENDQSFFKNMPLNQDAVIIAIQEDNGVKQFAMSRIKTNGTMVVLNLVPKSDAEISESLSELVIWENFL